MIVTLVAPDYSEANNTKFINKMSVRHVPAWAEAQSA
ncbi:hypothetical protein FVEN_g12672 [Fusarium venenatum]|nr:hypothetical protein FVEN_g12672 [Fusarium venenatum]